MFTIKFDNDLRDDLAPFATLSAAKAFVARAYGTNGSWSKDFAFGSTFYRRDGRLIQVLPC